MSTAPALKIAASRTAAAAHSIPTRHPPAVVVSAGRMQKTVKVRMIKQTWHAKLRKYFSTPTTALVHDPTSAVRAGDIIRMAASRHSKHVRHIVAEVVSPFGEALDQREGRVLGEEERLRQRDEKRQRKVERRAGRGVQTAVAEAMSRGWAVPDEFKHSLLAERTHPRKTGDQVGGEATTVARPAQQGDEDEVLDKVARDTSHLKLGDEDSRQI